MNKNVCNQEYEFVLTLSGVPELTQEVEDALFEAGCDDATLGIRFGQAYLAFCREAPSFEDAVLSAIRDVTKAGIGASVLRVDDCNLVTQAEIARRMGRSRQMVHQYITGKRGPGKFPPPECHISDGGPLWLWCEVAYWLWQNDLIKEEDHHKALVTEAVNEVLDDLNHRHRPSYPELAERVRQAISV